MPEFEPIVFKQPAALAPSQQASVSDPESVGEDDANRLWCVYLLLCADQTTYLGATRDLESRLRSHNRGTGARYTRGRRPVTLLGQIGDLTHAEALRLERQLKRRGRAAKMRAFAETVSPL